jgi:hypothetical protein
VAIERNPRYSPLQHRQNDAAILGESALALSALGWSGDTITEAAVERGELPLADLYLNMCQGEEASRRLLALERVGARMLNRPSSVLNCHRHRLVQTLEGTGVPFPATRIVLTAGPLPSMAELCALAAPHDRLWVKRGDVHAEGPEDVVAVEPEAVPEAVAAFAARGIERVALQRHVAGRAVKFYAIAGGAFFRWYDPADGSPTPVRSADEPALRALARHAGAALRMDVFGGDIVLPTHGGPVLIDLNDWPSFAPCRLEAARAIAAHAAASAAPHLHLDHDGRAR